MNLIGKKNLLRAIEERDLEQLHIWANDSELWSLLGGWKTATHLQSLKAWYASQGTDAKHLRYVIEDKHDHTLIGTANLINIDMKNGNAFHGMLLGHTDRRSKGYGTDTVMSLMRYAFDELRLERLDTDIIEYNKASLGLYTGKCGWKEEGRQRRWHFRKGAYWDRVIVGITRQDYEALIAKTDYWHTD